MLYSYRNVRMKRILVPALIVGFLSMGLVGCGETTKEETTTKTQTPGGSVTEKQINEETALAVPDAPKPQAEFTRGQLGKARRAFAKAGQPNASEAVRKKWLAEMSAANRLLRGTAMNCRPWVSLRATSGILTVSAGVTGVISIR